MQPKAGSSSSECYVEISQKPTSKKSAQDIEKIVKNYLRETFEEVNAELSGVCPQSSSECRTIMRHSFSGHDDLSQHINRITISCPNQCVIPDAELDSLSYRVYRLKPGGPCPDEIDDDPNERTNASCQWELPNEDLDEHWENLVFEADLKEELLSYADTLIGLSLARVNPATVSYNRLLLLHGPPGSGKTSLSRALAQKLSIRLSPQFRRGVLIEINSHSLFSRWFSESGKLVMKMFERIHCLLEDKDCFVYLLIDEVESLASSRKSAIAGSEPSDAIRVVNALLTQIDHLRRFPNVLLLTTSNLAESIDPAFLDRVDFLQHIGPPSIQGVHFILSSCVQELISKKLLSNMDETDVSKAIKLLARKAVGLSGRVLRKLPVLAISGCRRVHSQISCSDPLDCQEFFSCLENLTEKYKKSDCCLDLNKASLLTSQ